MTRVPRLQIANGLYHVMARGNRRQRIFLDRRDGERFLKLLEDVIEMRGWRCHSYCLLPNHYHLLFETPQPDIAVGMHNLNSSFAHWFNKRHEVTGHLFERRYRSVLVESEEQFLETVRYIALNPVRSQLCERPELWSWSSYASLAGIVKAERFVTRKRVLDAVASDAKLAPARLRAFVAEGARQLDTFTSPGARPGEVSGRDELTGPGEASSQPSP